MKQVVPEIVIERNQKTIIGPYFKHSVGGQDIKEKTIVELSIEDDYLLVRFKCLDNPFVNDNYYFENNSAMYNQEVFEIFIANGSVDPTNYLEIEINPNNALFIAKMTNPDFVGSSLEAEFIEPSDSGIIHEVIKEKESWSGYLLLPLSLIKYPIIDEENNFRINFYRIILQKKQKTEQWSCSTKNSTFACWKSTESKSPAFHRTRYFGSMTIKSVSL